MCSKYFAFAKNNMDDMTLGDIIDFWLSQERRQVKPLCPDNAARICNSLLYHSFLNRQTMGDTKMLRAHILNSAFLRQSCTSSVTDIADAFNESSADDEFFNCMSYLKVGVETVSSSKAIASNSGIDKYLELNHADDVNILDSSIVEGQVMVKFGLKEEVSSKVFHIELTSNLSEQILRPVYEELGIDRVRFTYDEKVLSPIRKIFPSELGMKSRGEYTINVTSLTEKEVNAQECIGRFMMNYYRRKRVRAILARNIVSDFVWRCHEKDKAKKAISAFIWHCHQQRKARTVIRNLIWRKVALRRRQKCRHSAISIQKLVRGVIDRGTFLKALHPKLDAVRQFYAVWKKAIEQVPHSAPSLTGWGLVRERLDLKRVDLLDDDGNLADTDEKLNQALSIALSEEDESEEIENEGVEEALDNNLTFEENQVNVQESMIDWTQFQVSVHILFISCVGLLGILSLVYMIRSLILISPAFTPTTRTIGNESCGQVYEEWRCQVQGDVREEDETACQR